MKQFIVISKSSFITTGNSGELTISLANRNVTDPQKVPDCGFYISLTLTDSFGKSKVYTLDHVPSKKTYRLYKGLLKVLDVNISTVFDAYNVANKAAELVLGGDFKVFSTDAVDLAGGLHQLTKAGVFNKVYKRIVSVESLYADINLLDSIADITTDTALGWCKSMLPKLCLMDKLLPRDLMFEDIELTPKYYTWCRLLSAPNLELK